MFNTWAKFTQLHSQMPILLSTLKPHLRPQNKRYTETTRCKISLEINVQQVKQAGQRNRTNYIIKNIFTPCQTLSQWLTEGACLSWNGKYILQYFLLCKLSDRVRQYLRVQQFWWIKCSSAVKRFREKIFKFITMWTLNWRQWSQNWINVLLFTSTR